MKHTSKINKVHIQQIVDMHNGFLTVPPLTTPSKPKQQTKLHTISYPRMATPKSTKSDSNCKTHFKIVGTSNNKGAGEIDIRVFTVVTGG